LHERLGRHASAQNAGDDATQDVMIPLVRLFVDGTRSGADLVSLPTTASYHYAEMWKLDTAELKYVRDVRLVRTAC
jgi:hypothetical protein